MPLETVALEVLDDVGLAVLGVDLGELLGDRVAVDRETSVGVPIAQEAVAEDVAGGGGGRAAR